MQFEVKEALGLFLNFLLFLVLNFFSHEGSSGYLLLTLESFRSKMRKFCNLESFNKLN